MSFDFSNPVTVNGALIGIAAGIAAGAPKMRAEQVAQKSREIMIATMLPPNAALLAVAIDSPLFKAASLSRNLQGEHNDADDRYTESELAGRAAALLLNDPSVDLQMGPEDSTLELNGANDGPGRMEDLTSALFYVLREIARVERSQAAQDLAAAETAAAAAAAGAPPQ